MRADWRCCAIFVVALCLTTFGIGVYARYELRPATAADITDKLDALPHVDTIGIGSSRMWHEFDSAAIAAASAHAGCAIEAYNLGVGGLNGIEMRLLLKKIAAMRPPGLKRIVFDMPNHIHLQFANLNSRRAFVTTDPADAPLALEDILSHPDPRKASALARYAVATLYENSAIGTLTHLLAPAAPAVADTPDDPLLLGYAPLDAARASRTPEHRHLEQNYESFTKLVGQLHQISLTTKAPAVGTARSRLRSRITDAYIDLIKSFGYEPVLLLLPDTYPEAIRDAAMLEAHVHAARAGVTVINLMSSAYADTVYEPAAWWDWTHLSAATVDELSRNIGRDLCAGAKDRIISEIKHAVR